MKFDPSKIVCVGLNYIDHADELKMAIPKEPIIFLKPPTSVIGDGEAIVYPERMTKNLHYEAELAIVIKDKARNISPDEAAQYILGYTCANDVTARDLQNIDGQWTRAKSFDTFCPIGPTAVKDVDPAGLDIKLYLNGAVKQSSNTSRMIFKPLRLVSFISQVMTLLPGDVILTGTPPGVGPMRKGDTVVVEIEGIGRLTNKVV
jgi:2-keto-4-pentenoate hydratase/2-oxohepta-3-ene-1,7-dioic acid hydratase in catechol pathway